MPSSWILFARIRMSVGVLPNFFVSCLYCDSGKLGFDIFLSAVVACLYSVFVNWFSFLLFAW